MITTFSVLLPSLGSSQKAINIQVDLCYWIIAMEIEMTTGCGHPAYEQNLFDAKIK